MKSIAIIGAGKLGTSLGKALSKAGFTITSLSCSTLPSARESRRIIGQGEPSANNIETARRGEILILSVPDDEINTVVQELESADNLWTGKLVFHCSGRIPAEILSPLQKKGASTASLHPIQTFSQKDTDVKIFQNTHISLEGDETAVLTAKKIVLRIGGHPIVIKAEDKPLYHAALSLSSNFFVVLLDTAVTLLRSSGLDDALALRILLPLMEGAFQNVKTSDIRSSLTGPVIRGDKNTVRAHLEALQTYPEIQEIYRKLAAQALEIAKGKKRLSDKKIKELTQILEDR
jgi:predicted short-subunit dehydrogenase-like oxidoreductase (DUF2520 family)